MALKPKDKYVLLLTIAFIAFCTHMLLYNAGVATYRGAREDGTNWTDFLHLVFMSGTTIGFGDLVPVKYSVTSV
jgi:Ion channel.